MRRSLGGLVLLGLIAGCAAPVQLEHAPVAARWSPAGAAEVDLLAGLLRLEDTRGEDPAMLEKAAADAHPLVRRNAAMAAGRLLRPAAIPLLTRLLADSDTAVAAMAAFSLGQIGHESALAELSARLRPDSVAARPTVAAEAAYALGKVRGDAARQTLERFLLEAPADPVHRPAVRAALLAIWRHSPEEVAPAQRWLSDADAETRWRAVYALARRPSARAAPLLLPAADDTDDRARSLALRGLTRPNVIAADLDQAAVLDLLVERLADESYQVRVNAARSLGSYAEGAVDPLLSALGSGEPHLVLTAIGSLEQIGAPAAAALPSLRVLAADESVHVALRAAALGAIGAVGGQAAAGELAAAASAPDWRLRAAAAQAVIRGRQSPADARRLLDDPDPRVRSAAVGAVAQVDDAALPSFRGVLLQALGASDVMVRAAALRALGRSPTPDLLPALVDAYARAEADEQNDAALAALDALAALRRTRQEPTRVLFSRFQRPADAVVRLKAAELFGEDAARAWGAALPVETGSRDADYAEIVRQWMLPALYGDSPRALIATDRGEIELRLFAGDAPLTVVSFLRLAESGFFDGQEWPRVVPNFVVQGGDPRGDTSGGPDYAIRDELNRHLYGTGTLGMALSGPDTGGSQWFVTHSPQPHLDGTYTVFGEAVDGLSAARRILPGDRILSIRAIRDAI